MSDNDNYVDLWIRPEWTYETHSAGAGWGRSIWTTEVKLHLFAGDVGGSVSSSGSDFSLDDVSGEYFVINPHPWHFQQYWMYREAISNGDAYSHEIESQNSNQSLWHIPTGTYFRAYGGGKYEHTQDRYGNYPSYSQKFRAYGIQGQNNFYHIPPNRHHTIGSPDYTGYGMGSYTTATNVYLDGPSFSDDSEGWFEEFQVCENALKACIAANGRYPLNPSVAATFGSYNAGTNIYSAGGNAYLSAAGWYAEFSQCATALASAMSEIDRLKADLFIAQQAGSETNQPQATAAPEIQIQTVNQPVPPPPERTEDVADDPLGELPDFVELVFEPRAEIPQIVQSDDISDLGLLRRTRFAQPTDDVAAFSEFTYNTTTFSPRETVSPAFQGEDDGVFEGAEFESERRRRDATGQ